MKGIISQIIDSSGNLPRDLIKRYKISEAPFYFKFKSTDYVQENVDYETEQFFDHMEKNPNDIPKTAAPNVYDWLSLFKERYAQGARRFIVTTISSKLSASFQTAITAKEMFKKEHGDVSVEIINSNTCACGQAALEIWIARMIERGEKYEGIVEKAREMIPRVNTLFAVESLKYMQAGGRIGGAAALLGVLINIKPVCEFVQGEVRVIKPVIGRKRSLKTLIDEAVSRITDIQKSIIVLQNAKSEKDAEFMCQYLKEKTKEKIRVFSNSLGITVGAHSGPGSIGIGFVEY
ncbi:MAG: DegV family protein [Firmicutes bacterium]|nr:DegV family protein [Bacillota bacterium]